MVDAEQRFIDVVQGLCDEGGRLLHFADDTALVAMPDHLTALVVSAGERSPDELERLFRTFAKRTRRVSSALVLIGGERRHRDALARAQPRVMIGRVVQVLMLGDDRQPWVGPSSRLDAPIGAALRAASRREQPRPVDVEALRATIDPAEAVAGLLEDVPVAAPTVLTHPRSYATPALVAGYVLVFLLEEAWGGAELHPTLVRMGAVTSEAFGGEPWRLMSSSWLHIGGLHLLLDVSALAMLGWLLEPWLGWRRLVLLHFAATLGAGLASAAAIGDGLSAGSSGAVFGLLGAALVLAWRPGQVVPETEVGRIRGRLTIYAIACLALSLVPGIDLMSHLGGGLVGAALTRSGLLIRGLTTAGPRATDGRLTRWAIAAIALQVASVAVAIVVGAPWELAQVEPKRTHELADGDATIAAPEILGEPRLSGHGLWRKYEIGDIRRDLLMVELVILRDDGTTPPAELAAARERLLEHPPNVADGVIATGEPRQLEDAAYPTTERSYRVGHQLELVVWSQRRPAAAIQFTGMYWTGYRRMHGELRAMFDSLEVSPAQ
jgi:rhomboid protease GluP